LTQSTVAEVIADSSDRMQAAGLSFGHACSSPWDEATALVLSVCELPDHIDALGQILSSGQLAQIERLLNQRIEARVPLPYLLGQVKFAGLDFLIEPGVVIPRSPIGELIQQRFEPWLAHPPGQIIDLCCGSGCIGIATALMFPDSELTLVDIDPQAVALSAKNVARHGLEERTRVVCSDLWCDVPDQRFDLILTNPPYVDAADMSVLPPEYLHEPALGLAGGDDGLAIVRRILDQFEQRVSAQGLLVGEVGNSASALLRAYPRLPFFWPDLELGGEGVFLLAAEPG